MTEVGGALMLGLLVGFACGVLAVYALERFW